MTRIYYESAGRLIAADILTPAQAEARRTIAHWVEALRVQNRRPRPERQLELTFQENS